MKRQILSGGLAALGLIFSLPVRPVAAADSRTQGAPPKEVLNLVGSYSGSWTNFGIDGQGQLVKRSAWTDTMKAQKPVREATRTFVSTEDEMVFAERAGAPFKVVGKEGYLLNNDGTLGDYFIETFGQTYRMQRLADGIWSYATGAPPQELLQLGFPKGVTGRHVVVKVVTQEDGVETHRVSRVTTVSWKDTGGTEHWLQYVSLQGFHKRRV